MILNDIKRVPPNALLGAYVTMPNGNEFKCVNYYVDMQNNNFLLELQSSKDPTSRQGYCLSDMTYWSISLQGGFVS